MRPLIKDLLDFLVFTGPAFIEPSRFTNYRDEQASDLSIRLEEMFPVERADATSEVMPTAAIPPLSRTLAPPPAFTSTFGSAI